MIYRSTDRLANWGVGQAKSSSPADKKFELGLTPRSEIARASLISA
jgi:hypothetical protein